MRDPHVQWCERCTPLSLDNGAAYSILEFLKNMFCRQMPVVWKQSPALQKEAIAVRKHLPAVQKQPPALQKEPIAVQKQMPAVCKQPTAVWKQLLALRKQMPVVWKQTTVLRI